MEAEVTRDEFGGYCCKRWGKTFFDGMDGMEYSSGDDDNICDLLGFDVEKKALEIVKSDLEKKKKSLSPSKIGLKVC